MPSISAAARFVVSACLYPQGLLDGFRSQPDAQKGEAAAPAQRSAQRLAEVVATEPKPSLWLNCGDWIYSDATAGLFDPTSLDTTLDEAYVKRAGEPALQMALKAIPQVCLIDDHEIVDNWEPSAHRGRNYRLIQQLRAARRAFRHVRDPGRLWFSDTFAGHAFFFGDTRTERSARDRHSLDRATIMTAKQFEALCHWLKSSHSKSADRYRFIATPSILLPRRLATAEAEHTNPAAALRSDAWDGYPESLHALLAFIADEQIQNCVFLSGDEHLGCVATVTVRRKDRPIVRLRSVHVGAMYAPYPFANSTKDDFAGTECFHFQRKSVDGTLVDYECEVDTRFADIGDGFAMVSVEGAADKHPGRFSVEFHAARGAEWNKKWSPKDDARDTTAQAPE